MHARFFLLTVIAVLFLQACTGNSSFSENNTASAETNLAGIALRLDQGSPQISTFVGPNSQAWGLTYGRYFIAAVDQNQKLTVAPDVQVGETGFNWEIDLSRSGAIVDQEKQEALFTLVRFLLTIEETRLLALDYSSNGFTVPLFTSDPTQAELDQLLAQFAKLSAQEQAVMQAQDTLGASLSSHITPAKVAAPSMDWKETLFGIFGFLGNTGARASQRIERITSLLASDEKEEAFEAVREELRGGAGNFDELLSKLKNGDLNNEAAQIESDMRTSPGFVAAAQDSGATTAQVVHEEGGQFVAKGAETSVFVTKVVLNTTFPGIAEGWDLADKATKWSAFARSVYVDPANGLGEIAADQIKEQVKGVILGDLKDHWPDMEDTIADEIADKVAGIALEGTSSTISEAAAAPDSDPDSQPDTQDIAVLDFGETNTTKHDCDESGTYCLYSVDVTLDYKTPLLPATIWCQISGIETGYSEIFSVPQNEGTITITVTSPDQSKYGNDEADRFVGCQLEAEGLYLSVSKSLPHAETEVMISQ